MKATLDDIKTAVQRRFYNHKYELFNSYVFNWECDFFSMTDSSYCYEVEIKISRGDFFADFKKDKHDLFKRIYSKQKYYWKNLGLSSWRGDVIGQYEYGWLVTINRRRFNDYGEKVRIEETATHQDYINHYKNFDLNKRTIQVRASCTDIKYIDLEAVNCPNRFFYAVPEGLIKKEEVPAYAGLIYIHDRYSVEIVKDAPFLHKRKLDLKGVLLEKFYYECKNLRNKITI